MCNAEQVISLALGAATVECPNGQLTGPLALAAGAEPAGAEAGRAAKPEVPAEPPRRCTPRVYAYYIELENMD